MVNEYFSKNVRNVAIIGHGGTGKTSLLDAMLYIGGKIERIGDSASGNLTGDYDEEEKERKISIRSALGFVEIDGVKINIMDTPGTSDFVGEAHAAIQMADTVILVIDSIQGVQIETEKAWRYLKKHNIPRIIFVNKMDKPDANYQNVITHLRNSLKVNTATICIPYGEGESFDSVIDIIDKKRILVGKDNHREQILEIPDSMIDLVEEERKNLIEQAAEGDDELIEKFLEGVELSCEETKRGIDEQLLEARLSSVICGSAKNLIGVRNLLNVIKNYVPSPNIKKEYKGIDFQTKNEIIVKNLDSEPFSAVVWKTYIDQYAGRFNYIKVTSGILVPETELFNSSKNVKEKIGKIYTIIGNKPYEIPTLHTGDVGVILKLEKTATKDTLSDLKRKVILPIIEFPNPVFSYAISAKKSSDDDKLTQYLHKVIDEKPTIRYEFNSNTNEALLSGMGELQLNTVIHTLKEKYKIDVNLEVPKISYRETIKMKSEAEYKHKKQSGGHGQYGEVALRVKPLKHGEGYQFINSIVGGVVPKQYIPGVEKGIAEAMKEGVLGKFPVVDLQVELYDGSYHSVDSSEMSFKIAAKNGFKKAMEKAVPQLLEPVMEVRIYVDKEYVGDILNDITSRRGKVISMDDARDSGVLISLITAAIPLSEMARYVVDLKSMSSGKGSFEMNFSHYEEVDQKLVEKIIDKKEM